MPLFLIARLGGETVALDTAAIGSVVELERIVPVPRAPRHVAGLCALRSHVLTVIDGAAAIGRAPTVAATPPIAVACDIDGHGYALLVDAVDDVIEAPAAEPCPMRPGAAWARAQRGLVQVDGRAVLLLDPAMLIAGDSAIAIEAAPAGALTAS